LYNANCSGCHGTSKASAPQANTASKLQSVLAGVNNHVNAGLDTRFTQQQLLDLAAYIASAK
jgi:mono/diheme cytochrome c family protein